MNRSMADRFGAEVQLSFHGLQGRQLFFVRASAADVNLPLLARSHGGRLVLRGENWLIAEMGLSESLALRREPGVVLVGGVTLDAERHEAFLRVTGSSDII